ncbi:MAG: tyrosine-type recombinase/integrase [Candidatus Bathyarchaeia archaeon]
MSVEQFLESVTNPLTRKEYRHGLKKWVEYYGKTAEQTLQERKDDLTQRANENLIDYKNRAARFEKEIEKFHGWMREHGSAINSARTLTLGIRQLFSYYQMPVTLRNGSKATKTEKTTRSFPLAIEHDRKMFAVADLRERVILSMATDLGLRMEDFISLKKADLPDLSQEAPISFDIMTSKENVVAHGFLSAESLELLKTYLQTMEQKAEKKTQEKGEKYDNPFLFASNGESHISDETVNRILKGLAEKAKIPLNGKDLSFHCFRKMFLAASVDSGAGLVAGKIICGKSVPQSDDTYLGTVNLREKFKTIKKFLTITETTNKEEVNKIEDLKAAVVRLQEQLSTQQVITQTIQQQNDKLKSLTVLADYLSSLDSTGEIQTYFMDLDSAKGHMKGVYVGKVEGQTSQLVDKAIHMTVKRHKREYDKGETAKAIRSVDSALKEHRKTAKASKAEA